MKDFTEYIFDSYINESMLYFSPRFKGILKSISNESDIAKKLLSKEGTDISQDITLIDTSDDLDYLSFMPIKKAQKIINDYYPNAGNSDISSVYNSDVTDFLWFERNSGGTPVYSGVPPVYTGSSRNLIKIGKFANKVLNNKESQVEIEKFANLIKANNESNKETIEVVEGEDIRKYYKRTNYLYKSGSIMNSCMSDKTDLLDIYVNNKESCKLVILKSGEKISARALLWKIWRISSPDEKTNGKINSDWFLDRVYSTEDYKIDTIRKWALEKGHVIRKYNSGYDTNSVLYKNFKKYRNTEISIKVKPSEYDKYPYLDTFMRYDSKSGILYNDDEKRKGGHILRSTEGYYTQSIPRRQVIVNRFRDFLNI